MSSCKNSAIDKIEIFFLNATLKDFQPIEVLLKPWIFHHQWVSLSYHPDTYYGYYDFQEIARDPA